MEYIYILRSFTREKYLLKLGFTTNVWARLKQYKFANPGIEIVYIAQLENALELEQAFHKENPSAWGNEWYDENKLEIMMKYLNNIPHTDYTNKSNPKKVLNLEPNFKDTVIAFKKGNLSISFVLTAAKKYPFLPDAVEKLGYSGIKELKYSITNIKSKLITLSKLNDCYDIAKDLELVIVEGQFYEAKDLKKILFTVYSKYNPNVKVTAKSIESHYVVKCDVKRKGSKVIRGFTVIKKKTN